MTKDCWLNLRVQYMKVQNKLRTSRVHKLFWMPKKKPGRVHNMFWEHSKLAIFMYWTCNAMNNHFSYCGLVDARISDSEKDLPVFVVDFLSLKPYWEATFPPNHFSLYSNINKLIVHNEVTSKSAEKWPNVWPSINQNLKNQRPRTFYTHFNGSLALLFRT